MVTLHVSVEHAHIQKYLICSQRAQKQLGEIKTGLETSPYVMLAHPDKVEGVHRITVSDPSLAAFAGRDRTTQRPGGALYRQERVLILEGAGNVHNTSQLRFERHDVHELAIGCFCFVYLMNHPALRCEIPSRSNRITPTVLFQDSGTPPEAQSTKNTMRASLEDPPLDSRCISSATSICHVLADDPTRCCAGLPIADATRDWKHDADTTPNVPILLAYTSEPGRT